jgi:hypothetical protein
MKKYFLLTFQPDMDLSGSFYLGLLVPWSSLHPALDAELDGGVE